MLRSRLLPAATLALLLLAVGAALCHITWLVVWDILYYPQGFTGFPIFSAPALMGVFYTPMVLGCGGLHMLTLWLWQRSGGGWGSTALRRLSWSFVVLLALAILLLVVPLLVTMNDGTAHVTRELGGRVNTYSSLSMRLEVLFFGCLPVLSTSLSGLLLCRYALGKAKS